MEPCGSEIAHAAGVPPGDVYYYFKTRDELAAHGCPIGSLCSELNKRGRGLDRRAATIFSTVADWLADQFRQLGRPDAPELAMTMLATVQGAALLANTLGDARIMTVQIRRLERWIDSLCGPDTTDPTEAT